MFLHWLRWRQGEPHKSFWSRSLIMKGSVIVEMTHMLPSHNLLMLDARIIPPTHLPPIYLMDRKDVSGEVAVVWWCISLEVSTQTLQILAWTILITVPHSSLEGLLPAVEVGKFVEDYSDGQCHNQNPTQDATWGCQFAGNSNRHNISIAHSCHTNCPPPPAGRESIKTSIFLLFCCVRHSRENRHPNSQIQQQNSNFSVAVLKGKERERERKRITGTVYTKRSPFLVWSPKGRHNSLLAFPLHDHLNFVTELYLIIFFLYIWKPNSEGQEPNSDGTAGYLRKPAFPDLLFAIREKWIPHNPAKSDQVPFPKFVFLPTIRTKNFWDFQSSILRVI